MTEEHDIIDQAVRDRGRGYSVYSIPPGVLYRPPEARLRQLRGVDVFAAADKLNIPKPMGGGIKRNNSILLPQPHPHHQQQPRRPRASSRPGTPSTPYEYRHRPSVSQQQQQSPTEQRRRKDSNVTVYTGIEEWTDASNSSTSSFSSSLRYRSDGRRVDSGFESAQEDRYSTASTSTTGRNSTRSHKTSRYSPPPVPPIPKSQSGYDDFDPMTYGQFDNEYDQVFDSLQNMTIQEQRIRQRLNSNNEIIPQPSTSSSSCKDMTNKIRIKAHFSDTRILVVPNNITFEDLLSRIKSKFNAPDTLRLQYKDEDDEMVLMIDEDDLHMARQISRARNGDSLSSGEKMEIWCLAWIANLVFFCYFRHVLSPSPKPIHPPFPHLFIWCNYFKHCLYSKVRKKENEFIVFQYWWFWYHPTACHSCLSWLARFHARRPYQPSFVQRLCVCCPTRAKSDQ